MSHEEHHAFHQLQRLVADKARGKAACDRVQHLCDFMHKWTCGSSQMTLPQLKSSLKNLGVQPSPDDVAMVFTALSGDSGGGGAVPIHTFCDAMLSKDFHNSFRPRADYEKNDPAGAGGRELTREVKEDLERVTAHPQYIMGTSGKDLGPFPRALPEGAWAPTTCFGEIVVDVEPHPSYQYEGLKWQESHEKERLRAMKQARKALDNAHEGKAMSISSVSSSSASRSLQQQPQSFPANATLRPEQLRNGQESSRPVRGAVFSGGASVQSYQASDPGRMNSRKLPEQVEEYFEEDLDLSELLIQQFRNAVLRRGSGALHVLSQMLRDKSLGLSNGKRLDPNKLQEGIRRFGVCLRSKDVDILCAATSRGDSFDTSLSEFLKAIYGSMNDRRESLIEDAWRRLDPTGVSRVDLKAFASRFQGEGHPEVILGKLRKQDAQQDLLEQFGPVAVGGFVPQREFFEYYASVSGAIKDDSLFQSVLENSWPTRSGASGGGRHSTTRSIKNAVLVTYTNGSQSIVTLEKDLGKDIYNDDTVKRQLKKQGVRGVATCEPTG